MIVTLEQLHQRLTADAIQRNSVMYTLLTEDANKRHAQVMKGMDDLKAAEAALGTSVGAAIGALKDDAAKLTAALQGDDDDAVEAVAQSITAKAAALDAAVNPPAAQPDPAPQPDPASVGTTTL